MNKLTDKDLREALSRREARRTKPEVPADFCDNIMQEIAPKPARRPRYAWYAALAVAASVAIAQLFVWQKQDYGVKEASLATVPSLRTTSTKPSDNQYQAFGQPVPSTGTTHAKPLYRKESSIKSKEKQHHTPVKQEEKPKPDYRIAPANDTQVHYASLTETSYQDPARIDEFIAKFANYYKVKQEELECSAPKDNHEVSTVYVFPDRKEIDVFGRLLQVACQYSDETPGYFLNFSHRQFFFELKDMRKQLQYRWIAERINGKILLYGTNAPIGAKTSSVCYREYRDELMHINSINHKTKEI